MAGAIGQPTNETAPRELVQGEVAEIEEQQQAAPIAPQEGAAPAAPQIAAPPPVETLTTGAVAEILPGRDMPPVSPTARPSTWEGQVSAAILGMGTVSPTTRRLAMAMAGFPQAGVVPEVLPRSVEREAPLAETPGGTPVAAQAEVRGITPEQLVAQAASAEEA